MAQRTEVELGVVATPQARLSASNLALGMPRDGWRCQAWGLLVEAGAALGNLVAQAVTHILS